MKKEQITSLELLKQINCYRKQEGNRVELQHKTLLEIIRDEFSEEIGEQNILPTSKLKIGYYKDTYGRKQPMFILTLSQAKQVLVRESKYVRRATIQYLEKLEDRLLQIALNKLSSEWQELRQAEKNTRKQETDTIKELILYAKEQGSKHPEKLYSVYSKLVHTLLGAKSKDREALPLFDTLDVLRLEQLFDKAIQKGMVERKHYKKIYEDCKAVGKEYVKVIKIA